MFICILREGESLQVGDHVATLTAVPRIGVGRLTLDTGETVTVSWDRKVLLIPNVEVMVKLDDLSHWAKVKLLIDAPRDIRLERLRRGSSVGNQSFRSGGKPSEAGRVYRGYRK